MFSRRIKVTRENAPSTSGITRVDIGCGVANCEACAYAGISTDAARLTSDQPVLVPDAASLATYIDIFDDPAVSNVLILSTTLAAVSKRNLGTAARLNRLCADARRKFYLFPNDRHVSTAVERSAHESDEEFNIRYLRKAVAWLIAHNGSAACATFTVATHQTADAERLSSLGCAAVTLRTALESALGPAHLLLDRMQDTAISPADAGTRRTSEYWSAAQVSSALQCNAVFKGKLRCSEGSCFFGEIRGNFGDAGERILIPGRAAINRAVHDDVVVVLMDPVEKWKAPATSTAAPTSVSAAVKAGFSPTGCVVAVAEKNRRPYCGSIDVDEGNKADGLTGSVSLLFRPKSSRIPKIRITTKDASALKTKRLRVVIDDWPATSAYPVGHYTDVIGEIGDKDTEAQVILLENDIPHYDFSEAVYDCLPKGTWSVEDSELKRRKDLRHLSICSVDPLGCRDIDDALHFRQLPNGNLEVGVHIADVTHFVLEGTPLDEEAKKRSTSVYLVDRRINMLPQLLTENLCSIVGDEDRYAFSVIWEFGSSEDMPVVSEWFGKSIIRSRAALYYGDAQKMIDDVADNTEMSLSLRGLMRLSRILKQKRDEAGALTLGSQEFKFKIDNDHVNPTDMVQYQTFETNSMVEEWMLYANVAAARQCYTAFPAHALLRRHQAPADRACAELNKALAARGLPPLDVSTSKALNMSLNTCVDTKDPFLNRLVRILTTRCLKQAQYFCSGDLPYEDFLHYGLAMPIYTHFTSPIRRYADVVVHRQLAAITGTGEFSADKITTEDIAAIAVNINYRHEMAQKAGRDSQNLFTGFFLRKYAEGDIPIESGYVTKVSEQFVAVMVPSIGQEGRVPIDSMPTDMGKQLEPLDRVRVKISLVREGDVLSAKLAFRIAEVEVSDEKPLKRHKNEAVNINSE
jgi:exosome complex exonuclease DIS3/RRP44